MVLVPGVEGHSTMGTEVIILTADGPATIELFDFSTQSLSDDLVAKTHANHGPRARIDVFDQLSQRLNKRVILVSAMF